MLKNRFSLCLAVCLLSVILFNPAYALEEAHEDEMSRYIGVHNIISGLTIDSSGSAVCDAGGWISSGYTADLRISLYRVDNDFFQLISYWDVGTVSGRFTRTRSCSVEHGTYYSQAKLVVHDSDGNYVETVYEASPDYIY